MAVRSWGLKGSLHPPACRHPLPSADAIAKATVGGNDLSGAPRRSPVVTVVVGPFVPVITSGENA